MKQIILDHILDVARNATPEYKDLLFGIADHYEVTGELNAAQRRPVRIASSLQSKKCPVEFDELRLATVPIPEMTFTAPVEAVLDATEYEPCPGHTADHANALAAVKAMHTVFDMVSDLIEVLAHYRQHLADILGFDPDRETH